MARYEPIRETNTSTYLRGLKGLLRATALRRIAALRGFWPLSISYNLKMLRDAIAAITATCVLRAAVAMIGSLRFQN
jgi:hypothetical protein